MPAPTMSLASATSIYTAMKAPDESPDTELCLIELCLILAPRLGSDSATDDRAGRNPAAAHKSGRSTASRDDARSITAPSAGATPLERRNFFRAICLMDQKPLASLERGCKYAIVST